MGANFSHTFEIHEADLPIHYNTTRMALRLRTTKSSAVAEMGDRLVTIDMGRKLGAVPFFLGGELGPHLTQSRLCRGLHLYQVAS